MSVHQFALPDVGEGLTEAEIVAWKVKPGDAVAVNDVIVEIETAKSVVELPCPFAGVVDRLLVEEGTTVDVGTPIITVRTPDAPPSTGAGQPEQPGRPAAGEAPGEQRQAMLVGYGPRETPTRRRRKVSEPAPEATSPSVSPPARAPLAKPPVRKLAKDLGVALATVVPTGPRGTVTREDVRAAAARQAPVRAPESPPASAGRWSDLPREERVPIRSVRKATAQAMVRSAFTAPHVTEFVTIDVTRSVRFVERLQASAEFRDVKLSPLAVVARAVCLAARRTPEVNSRWDEDADEIVLQHYVNLGVAVATPRGLVVPNVKDADRLSLRELAVAINGLAATARDGATPPSDMRGGTISITNIGVFGVDAGTPILPPGEAAIVAFGAIRRRPWVHKNKVKARWVTTLGLSFDHRLVDGAQGSRFLTDVAGVLEDPANALVLS